MEQQRLTKLDTVAFLNMERWLQSDIVWSQQGYRLDSRSLIDRLIGRPGDGNVQTFFEPNRHMLAFTLIAVLALQRASSAVFILS